MSDNEQTRIALTHLARLTAPEGACYFYIWDGYSNVTLPVPSGRRTVVGLKHRQHVLMEPLRTLDTWELVTEAATPSPAGLHLAPDHRWCFASDVDPHWRASGPTLK